MQETPRAILHFLGGETLAIPPLQVDALIASASDTGLAQIQVGSRVTYVNVRQLAYIQMPSAPAQAVGDGAPHVYRIQVG